MTVAELIRALERLPSGLEVVTEYDGAAVAVEGVRVVLAGEEFHRLNERRFAAGDSLARIFP